jgi:hypothetical protein
MGEFGVRRKYRQAQDRRHLPLGPSLRQAGQARRPSALATDLPRVPPEAPLAYADRELESLPGLSAVISDSGVPTPDRIAVTCSAWRMLRKSEPKWKDFQGEIDESAGFPPALTSVLSSPAAKCQ